jgi:hypothetical protein
MWITTVANPYFGGISLGGPCGKFRQLDAMMRDR